MDTTGLLIIHTGNGKGKTTAALGQALRAAGQGLRVCFIQFIKNDQETGEAQALARYDDLIEFQVMGSGFTWKASDPEEPRQAALAGWALAREKLAGSDFDLVILDEFTYTLQYHYIDEDEALAAFAARPPGQHLLITGRNAGERLIAAADLVTEMQEIKHPFQNGRPARRGIEY